MPLYEFTCTACNHVTDARLPIETIISGEGFPQCQYCGADTTRVFSPSSVHVSKRADDMLNQAANGEGDPVPGMTKEETQKAATSMARDQKKKVKGNRHAKKVSPPMTSYPGGGVLR